MKIRVFLLCLAVCCAAAFSNNDPLQSQSLLLRAEQYFDAKAWSDSLALFEKAQETTTEPGMVAFNRATLHLAQEHYPEAEILFRCSLTDAPQSRRAKALVNLGYCILVDRPNHTRKRLREAIGLLERCLADSACDPALRTAGETNLELAKLLLPRLKPTENLGSGGTGEHPEGDRDNGQGNSGLVENSKKPTPADKGAGPPQNMGGNMEGPPSTSSDHLTPGKGNLPPLADADELQALTPGEVHERLRQELSRIEKEAHPLASPARPAASSTIKNW